MNPHQPPTHCHQGTTLRPIPEVVESGPVGDASAAVEVFMQPSPDEDDGRKAVHIADALDDLFRRDPGDPVAVITDDHRLVFIQSNETVWIDGKPCDASVAKPWKRVRIKNDINGIVPSNQPTKP